MYRLYDIFSFKINIWCIIINRFLKKIKWWGTWLNMTFSESTWLKVTFSESTWLNVTFSESTWLNVTFSESIWWMQMRRSGDNCKTHLLSQIDWFFFQCTFVSNIDTNVGVGLYGRVSLLGVFVECGFVISVARICNCQLAKCPSSSSHSISKLLPDNIFLWCESIL